MEETKYFMLSRVMLVKVDRILINTLSELSHQNLGKKQIIQICYIQNKIK